MPEELVAETLALRKKTNSIRGTAGLERKLLIKKIAEQKKQSTNRLAYTDPLVHPQPALAAEAPAPPAPALAAEALAPQPPAHDTATRLCCDPAML